MSPHVAALVLLLLNATPSAGIESSTFRYALFSNADALCDTQYLSLIGYAATIISSAIFGKVFRRGALHRTVIIGGLLAAAATLLDLPLPLLCARSAPPPDLGSGSGLPDLGSGSAPHPPCNIEAAFAVAAISALFGGIISELGFLPQLVIATQVNTLLSP